MQANIKWRKRDRVEHDKYANILSQGFNLEKEMYVLKTL